MRFSATDLFDYPLAQLMPNDGQSEYLPAYALTIALVLLGLLVVCVPRPRTKHFVEPEEDELDKINKRK